MLAEPTLVVAMIVPVFDSLGIRYVVGGSFASSIHGIPRATQDVDLVADVRLAHADAIARALTDEFYVDADMIREAVRHRSSFNVIHLATSFKADVFILKGDAWSLEEMSRARVEQLEIPGGTASIRFASPEDTLLHKLVWYEMGNRISERQWNDVLGMLKIQGDALDHEYLDRWAPVLGVVELLARARQEQRAGS